MPADVRKTNVLGKMAGRIGKAHETHKNDETKYGIVELPPGITAGIARLVMCKLDTYDEDKKTGAKKGDPYVVFRAIVVSPEEHNGVRCKGQGATKSIPLCDTVKERDGQKVQISFDDNYGEFLNELRKFGINTAAMPANEAGIYATLASLEKAKILTRFSTRGWTPPPRPGDPNPKEMVFTQFDGAISAEEAEKEVGASSSPASGFAAPTGSGSSDSGADDGQTVGDGGEDFDLITVAAAAQKTDANAIERMKDEARKYGITEDEIENAPDWDNVNNDGTSLRELIEAKMSEGGEGQTPEQEPDAPAWEPKVKGMCKYQIKAGGKVHDCRIDKIDKKAGTADLTNITDGKTKYASVKLEKLSAA